MPKCNHSWCDECNDSINKNNISNCPLCKIKFNNILKKGKWKLHKNNSGFYFWKWHKGINDSKKKLKIRKIQEIIYNVITIRSSSGVYTHLERCVF
jgi:hypothetical protein